MAFARSVSIVTAINLVGSLVSVLNVSVMAYFFGASESIEIYFASTLLLTTILTFCNAAQIPDVVLPLYHRVRERFSLQEGQRAISIILNWYLLFALVLLFVTYHLLPYIINLIVPGFSDEAKAGVHSVMLWVLPLAFFSLLVQFFVTLINAESQFGRPELIALLVKVVALLSLVLLVRRYDYWALVIGLWLGMALRISAYLYIMRKLHFTWYFSFRSSCFSLRKTAKQFLASSAYAVSTQFYQLALNAGVSQLPQGTFAIYSYISQLASKTNGIFLRPISLVFFTKASQIISRKQAGLGELSKQALSLFSLTAVPIILFTFLYGQSFLAVLLGLEKISIEQNVLGTRLLQTFFALLVFGGLANICRKVLLSTGHAEFMYWTTGVVQLLSASLALYLLPDFGAEGLIIALVFSVVVSTVWLVTTAAWKAGEFFFYDLTGVARWLPVVFVTTAACLLAQKFFPLDLGKERLLLFFELGLHSVLYVTLIFVLGLVFRVAEVVSLANQARSVLSR